jgi:hypothetical protein
LILPSPFWILLSPFFNDLTDRVEQGFSSFNIAHTAVGRRIVTDPCELEDQFVRRRQRLRRAWHRDNVGMETQPGNEFMAIDCLVWDGIYWLLAACELPRKPPEWRQ